jgi:hypothetical protein
MIGIDHDMRQHRPQPLHIPTSPAQTRPCPIIWRIWRLFLLLRCISSFAKQGGVDPTVRLQQWRSPCQVVQYTIQARRTVRSARRIIRLIQLPALVLDRTRRNSLLSLLCHWGIHVGRLFTSVAQLTGPVVETPTLSNTLNLIRRLAFWSKPRAPCSVWRPEDIRYHQHGTLLLAAKINADLSDLGCG